jgi:hypothetical protein
MTGGAGLKAGGGLLDLERPPQRKSHDESIEEAVVPKDAGERAELAEMSLGKVERALQLSHVNLDGVNVRSNRAFDSGERGFTT